MKKKQLWKKAIAALTLIAVSFSLYYLDKTSRQNVNMGVESPVSKDLINEPETSLASQYAFLGKSPDNNQPPDDQSVKKHDEAKEQQGGAASTYDKEIESSKPGAGKPDSSQEQSAKNSQENNQPAVNNNIANNPSRSGSIYNRLSPSKGSYGQFRYRELGGGRIEIDPQWVAQNIVTITLPGLNRNVQVNRAAKDKFIKAFTYIKNGTAIVNGREVPLLSLIKTMDGTFVSRHVNWNPANGLSNHSWGIAIDINASNHFGYVSPGDIEDPNRILWEKAFKPAGFSWGNSYSDSMHFELLD